MNIRSIVVAAAAAAVIRVQFSDRNFNIWYVCRCVFSVNFYSSRWLFTLL